MYSLLNLLLFYETALVVLIIYLINVKLFVEINLK